MVKKKEDELALSQAANSALVRMMENLLIYVSVLKEDENIKKTNAKLIAELDKLAQVITELQIKAKQQKTISGVELAKAAKVFINVNELMKNVKFEDPKGAMLKRLGQKVMADAKAIESMPEQARLDRIQRSLVAMGAELKKDMETVVRSAQPKKRGMWQKFVDGCREFGASCRKVFAKLFSKKSKQMEIQHLGGQPGSPQTRLQQQMAADKKLAVQKGVVDAVREAPKVGRSEEKSQQRESTEKRKSLNPMEKNLIAQKKQLKHVEDSAAHKPPPVPPRKGRSWH